MKAISIVGTASTLWLSAHTVLAAETVPFRLELDALVQMKDALQSALFVSSSVSIPIMYGRQKADQTVYVCGLVSVSGPASGNFLFFAEWSEDLVELVEIDQDDPRPGRAKKLCDQYGFDTPTPGPPVLLDFR